MKGTKQAANKTGKVMLAIMAGVLMPILIWVALGVAVNQRLRQTKARQAEAPTIDEILARAGLIADHK